MSAANFDIIFVGFLLGHGGDAIQMREIACGLARRGKQVKIIVPAIETTVTFAQVCQAEGLPVERSSLIRCDGATAKQNFFSMIRLLTQNRARILHFYSGGDCLPRTLMFALRLIGSPHAVATFNSPKVTMTPGEPRANFWARNAPKVLRRIINTSLHAQNTQIEYGVPTHIQTLIYNGVDIKRYANGDSAIVRSYLGVSHDAPLVIFTSRLEPQKRPHDALESFYRVSGEFPDAHMIFVGSGDLERSLRDTVREKRIEDRVHFVGYQVDIQNWLAAATVWTLPTDSENFSVALLEAMAAGCTILSTMYKGYDEILKPLSEATSSGDAPHSNHSTPDEEEANALCTPVGDVESQTQALYRLLSDPTLRQTLSQGALRTAEYFDIELIVSRYEKLYEESLDPSGNETPPRSRDEGRIPQTHSTR